MTEKFTPTENLTQGGNERDGLYRVSLPGIAKDPTWVASMEETSRKAVNIMEAGSVDAEVIMGSERNLSTLIDRLKRSHRTKEELPQAAASTILEFTTHPSLRDITDYVLADAHAEYRQKDPQFQPVKSKFGTARVISNYGTPRELVPAFETPFRGQYKINPYQGYVERALLCKEQYSDPDGYMVAPLAKLVDDPQGEYVFEQSADSDETLRLTQTLNYAWWHTKTENFDRIWSHINDLFTELDQLTKQKLGNTTKETKILLISQIGWWYFQMMPYTGGSAAIGNVLLQSLFDFTGIKSSPYKEGVAPDLEAYVTPLPIYAKNFNQFFTRELE